MEAMEALRIVLDLAEGMQITREEAEAEGPEMWRTYLEQQDALTMIDDIVTGRDSHGALIPA